MESVWSVVLDASSLVPTEEFEAYVTVLLFFAQPPQPGGAYRIVPTTYLV